ncbi:MAG: hypothetical protein KAH48_02835 [Chlorobi bacterium]|nr:hypothetical protein [Chlorobiota bacterium]
MEKRMTALQMILASKKPYVLRSVRFNPPKSRAGKLAKFPHYQTDAPI